jgi:hypothetical protein
MTDAFDNDDPIMEEGRKLVAENKALHEVNTATFQGGPADGLTFELPDGVNIINVAVEDGDEVPYVRSTDPETPNVFAVKSQD